MKLLDKEVYLQTTYQQLVKQTFYLPFKAVTDRSMVGMIISEGAFELRVFKLNVKNLGSSNEILTSNNEFMDQGIDKMEEKSEEMEERPEFTNDTLSHVASSESIIYRSEKKLQNNRPIMNLTAELLRNTRNTRDTQNTKNATSNPLGSFLEDTDYESTLHASDNSSDGENERDDRAFRKKNKNQTKNQQISSGSSDEGDDGDEAVGSDEGEDEAINERVNIRSMRSRGRNVVSNNYQNHMVMRKAKEDQDSPDISSLTDNGKHGKITINCINGLNKARNQVTASELSEVQKICLKEDEDKAEILGKCKECCETISRGPRGFQGEQGLKGATGPAGSSIFAITINWMGQQTECLMTQTCPSNVQYVLETRGCEVGACKLWECQNGVLQWLPNALDGSIIPSAVSNNYPNEYLPNDCSCKGFKGCCSTFGVFNSLGTTKASCCKGTKCACASSCVGSCAGSCTGSCKCKTSKCANIIDTIQTCATLGCSQNPFDTSICGFTGPTGPNLVCGEPVFTPLWFYDPSSCKLIRIVDKTCRPFIGNAGDKVLDTENGKVYEANCYGLWKPLPGSLKGPAGTPGSKLVAISTENLAASNSSASISRIVGLSGQTIAELPNALTLPENTLFYEISTGRILIVAGLTYGYVTQAWVLVTHLESDINAVLIKTKDNTFYDSSIPMIYTNNSAITSVLGLGLSPGDFVFDVYTGEQFLVKESSLELIGSIKGPQGIQGPPGETGKGIFDQVLTQVGPISTQTASIGPGGSSKLSGYKSMPVFFGNNEKLFNIGTNRIELPNYLIGPVLIKMNLFLLVGHNQNLTANDKIGVAIKKSTSIADWTLQTFVPNSLAGETLMAVTEMFTGNPGDIFDIYLRNLTSGPITIKAPQMAAGNRMFFEFHQSVDLS